MLVAAQTAEAITGVELDRFAREVIARTELGRAALAALEAGPHKNERAAALAALVLAEG